MSDAVLTPARVARAIPLFVLVPIVFGGAFLAAGYGLDVVALAIGALGWVVALVLRAPVSLVALRLTGGPERAQPWIVGSSGPLEEGVRVLAVLLVGRDLTTAFWLGLGWATIEVLYSIVNGFAIAALAGRDDPEAEQARAMLPPVALTATPVWGAVERGDTPGEGSVR